MAFITILHKRSNVEDRRPTTEDLFEGELALNTFDGKLFFKTVKNGVENVIEIGENFDGQYSNLTGAPTLLSSFTNDPGYITDYTVTLADVTQHESGITITESQISDLQNYLTAVSFGQVTDKPTTLAGYGITDAATAAQGALADTALQPGRNISTLQNNVGYLTSVSNTDVTQHQTDIIITESQISDLRPYLLSVSSSDVTQHQADLQLTQSQITDFYVSNNDVTQHQSEIRITESQITDLKTYATADNAMNFTNKTGNITQWTNDANYITNAQEINDLTANVTWTTVPDPYISQSAVVQHERQLIIFENQIGDLQDYLTAVSNTDVTQHQSDIRLNQSQIVDFAVTNTDVTQHQTDIRITESQITDLQAYLTSETTTSLVANTVSQELLFTDETGAVNSVDLSWAVDDTNLARLVSGTLDANTGIATFTRDDASTFTVNFNPLFDDTNLTRINAASFDTANGVLTLTRTDATEVTVDLDGRFLTEVTNTAVTAHQSDLQITESQITDLQAYITDYTVTVGDVTQHQGALQILESQVVGLGPYAPLSNGVVPDANISNTSIIQHQSELTITESQISDLGSYLTAEADTLDDVIGRGATTTTTAVIPFLYANQAAFPDASTYHGAIAHSHADGAMYFAHSGSWNLLANDTSNRRVDIGRDRDDSFARSLNVTGPITWAGSLDTMVGRGVTGATTYTDRFSIKHSITGATDDIQIELVPGNGAGGRGSVGVIGGLKVTDEIETASTLNLTPLSAAPSSPVAGMFAVADYTNWDPASSSTPRPYPVFYDGAVWNPLY